MHKDPDLLNMPIIRINNDLVYFAHVPKCAGSAIENYLASRFGPLAFLNRQHQKPPVAQRWSATSPQHIDWETLGLLFPEGFFQKSFAVVRHPASRLFSSFNFENKRIRIPANMNFERWLRGLQDKMARDPFALDNHARPMNDIVPTDAEVFRLEDGTDPIISWLDELEGRVHGPRAIPRSNETHDLRVRTRSRRQRVLHKFFPVREPVLDEALCRLVHELYPQDFERFGYGLLDPLSKGDKR